MIGFLKKNGWLILLAAVGVALLLLAGAGTGGDQKIGSDTESDIREICMAFPGVTTRSVKVSLSESVAASAGASVRVEGIAVVLHGSTARTRLQLTELLAAAYSLPANKICLVESG